MRIERRSWPGYLFVAKAKRPVVAVTRFLSSDFQAVMVAGCSDQRPELKHNGIFFGSVASRAVYVRDELGGVGFLGDKGQIGVLFEIPKGLEKSGRRLGKIK